MAREPVFPHWWASFDSQPETDVAAVVEVEGVALRAHGLSDPKTMIRWEWSDEHLNGFIVYGNWKDTSTHKRFGWVVGFTAKGLEAVPRYDGFWYAAGEAQSLKMALGSVLAAAQRARRLLPEQ
jgi:hypothetical protein